MNKDIDLFGKEIEYRDPNGNQIPGRTKTGSFINNPLIPLYGTKEGERCKNCAHLVRKSYSKVYYKCELRNNVDKCMYKVRPIKLIGRLAENLNLKRCN